MKKEFLFIVVCLLFLQFNVNASSPAIDYLAYAKNIANSEIMRESRPDSLNLTQYNSDWNYKFALLNNAYLKLYEATQEDIYFKQVKKSADRFLNETGVINANNPATYDLRNLCGGNFLYNLYYHNRGGKIYLNGMMSLRKQLYSQPRTQGRAFCFSKANKGEIRIDGLYMAMPFYCMYAAIMDEPKVFADIVFQFTEADEKTLDERTGLNYQAWDERAVHTWADENTGTTTALFAQSIGFYMMALVDVLDYFPIDHAYRNELNKKLNRITKALVKHQDSKSGMWYQVVNMPKNTINFKESSSTAMFAYAISKGVNKGYLSAKYRKNAEKAFKGLVDNCIVFDEETKSYTITSATTDAKLEGGDGTRGFYFELAVADNEPNAIAPFIMAAVELAK